MLNTAVIVGLFFGGQAFMPGWFPYILDVILAIGFLQMLFGMIAIWQLQPET